jgi:hypothetical protein
MTAGQSAFRSHGVLWAARAKRRCHAPFHWQIDFSVALPPCWTCCFAPNICSSLPWWLGFTRAAGNRQIKYEGGEVRAALGADVGRGPMLLIHPAVIRELAGSLGGIDAGTLPPHGFVPMRAEPVDIRTLMGNKPTFAWICAILNDDTGT